MDPQRVLRISEPALGLEAVLVIDSTRLGPAAGGVRTRRYGSLDEAEVDARGLARAMTWKCALAGLEAGGGKAVILERDDWDRPRVFARLGEIIEGLQGEFRTAGDLGTTAEDLESMAGACSYVHTSASSLASSVARGWLACAQAMARVCNRPLAEEGVLVQGCGAIGAAVARQAKAAGLSPVLADREPIRAEALAADLDARVVDSRGCLLHSAELLAPCAAGGVIGVEVAWGAKAWGVCGAANNIFAGRQPEEILRSRYIASVPDILSSAGAVIDGIGATVMGLEDRGPLIDALGTTAESVLRESIATGTIASEVAIGRARSRLATASRR